MLKATVAAGSSLTFSLFCSEHMRETSSQLLGFKEYAAFCVSNEAQNLHLPLWLLVVTLHGHVKYQQQGTRAVLNLGLVFLTSLHFVLFLCIDDPAPDSFSLRCFIHGSVVLREQNAPASLPLLSSSDSCFTSAQSILLTIYSTVYISDIFPHDIGCQHILKLLDIKSKMQEKTLCEIIPARTHTSKHPQMQGQVTGKCLYLVGKPWTRLVQAGSLLLALQRQRLLPAQQHVWMNNSLLQEQ